jgi:hypothetical protein
MGDNVFINTTHEGDRVFFGGVESTLAEMAGFRIIGAPGDTDGQTLNQVPLNVVNLDYGFRLEASTVHNNAGEGIVIGTPAADLVRVLALIGGTDEINEVYMNMKQGILLQGGALVGATIANNEIHDNTLSGLRIGSSVLVPFDDSGLGFKQNHVYHNAMAAAGCTSEQTAPQIFVVAPTAIDNTQCALEDGDQPDCNAKSVAGNNFHCVYDQAAKCRVSHDLRGSLSGCADPNRIFGFNIGAASSLAVGVRAEGASVADVRNNAWYSEKTSVGLNSFIATGTTCLGAQCGSTP